MSKEHLFLPNHFPVIDKDGKVIKDNVFFDRKLWKKPTDKNSEKAIACINRDCSECGNIIEKGEEYWISYFLGMIYRFCSECYIKNKDENR